MMYEPAFIKTI